MDRRKILIACVLLYALSAGVRLVVWQNNKVEMAGVQSVVAHTYKQDARPLLHGELEKFLAGEDPPTNANVLGHPPGYPIFIAAVWGVFGENDSSLIIQLLLNSLAPLFVFAIALRMFDLTTASIAGVVTAVAPQIAYHSGLPLPDELSVVPLLAALYFVVLARSDGRLRYALLAGLSIGVSCWLRSNAMLLPFFFAAGSLIVMPKEVRLKFASTLIAAFILVIAPITIRNYVFFSAFVPISLGSGTTFLEGLGDYDTDRSRGMPVLDEDVMRMDVARSGRADYYGYLYSPDGVERDRARLKDGMKAVEADPVWFATAVGHRALTSFRMERVPAIEPSRDERETTNTIIYYVNRPLKLIQRAFVTGTILPLFLFGILVLAWLRPRRRELLLLAIVPFYYATVQSLLHTEYRYVLATPHVMMILVAVGLSYLWMKITRQPTEQNGGTHVPETSPV